MSYYGRVLPDAARFGKPAMLYAVGVGPLRTPAGALYAARLAEAASAVTVRDNASVLAELNIRRFALPLVGLKRSVLMERVKEVLEKRAPLQQSLGDATQRLQAQELQNMNTFAGVVAG